jgi:hypothetical protein
MAAVFVEDRIVVPPGRLAAVRALLAERYLGPARERGLALLGAWITPPAELPGHASELLLLWSLPDLAAFWRMRGAAAADPAVAALWAELDALASRRERRFLAPVELA